MPREPLNDLDAELRELLAVDPSPEFAAQVRARVRADALTPGWWNFRWTAAAAATVLIVAGLLVFKASALRETTPALPPVAVVAQPRPPQAIADPPVQSRVAPVIRTARNGGRLRPVRRVEGAPREPEVVVDVRRRAAVQQFLAMARAGLLNAEVLPAEVQAPVDLVVEPLRIPAIGGGAGKQ
jgi:hypothetical protein